MEYKIGTKEAPMALKTPPLSSEYTMHTDEKDGKQEVNANCSNFSIITSGVEGILSRS